MSVGLLLGDMLLTKAGEASTASALQGAKHVALYFSAHWCPPCRSFTPQLAKVYTELKEKHGDAFQLVFVSSDHDEEAFSEYYGTMPWLALPFSERERKGALSSKFGVRGIPSLIMLEAETGKVIGKDCRSAVAQDGAAGFPWADPTVKGALAEYEAKGGKLRRCAGAGDKAGEETTATEIVASGKHLLLYFSASWCGPCHHFTPKLVEYYNKAVADGVPLEIVFVSNDHSAEEQDEYAKSMPWLEIPDCAGANKSLGSALSRAIGVNGIPTLAALRPDDELSVLADDGVGYVTKNRAFPAEWVPPLVPECEDAVESLNRSTCLIVMEEEAPEKQDASMAALEEVAREAKAKGDDKISFMVATETSRITAQIRKLAKLPARPKVGQSATLLLNLQEDRIFKLPSTWEATADSVREVVSAFTDNKLEQLGELVALAA